MAIINRISIVMGTQRLSVAEVAKKSGLSYEAVRRLYDGDSRRVDFDTLDKLCHALRCDVGYLLAHSIYGVSQLEQVQPQSANIEISEPSKIVEVSETGNSNETEALLVDLFN